MCFKKGGGFFFIAAVILALPLFFSAQQAFASSSIAVSSEELSFIDVSEINRDVVLSIQNNDNILLHISVMLEPDFFFLNDYIRFDPQILEIGPAETKNLKISLNLDKVYPQEIGIWILGYINEHDETANLSRITLKGKGSPETRLESHIFDTEIGKRFLVVGIKLDNTGNTLIRVKPKIMLTSKGEELKALEYPALPYLPPETSETYSFRIEYDLDDFEKYQVIAELEYEGQVQEASLDFVFTPKEEEQGESKKRATIILSFVIILGGACVSAYFLARFIYYSHKHKGDVERVRQCEIKVKLLEKKLSYLIRETEKIISQVS
ncbi:MAG TPA: hypothetical protein ENN46_03530 [Candidatus Woesearchaeota archaeon]|nr:hypothetical protein [Candidatus Woesearchaeota archaeon]